MILGGTSASLIRFILTLVLYFSVLLWKLNDPKVTYLKKCSDIIHLIRGFSGHVYLKRLSIYDLVGM